MDLGLDSTISLRNGVNIPVLGMGTAGTSGRSCVLAVGEALRIGYRLIDTASMYGNEREVGVALRESRVRREEVFITTKVATPDQGFASATRACDESLRRLGLDYVDLYLIHWPSRRKRVETWEAMEKLVASGKARAVGVSNFMVHHLMELREASVLVPAIDQIELSPFLQQREVVSACRGWGIQVEAYSPLTRGRRLGDPTLTRIAAAKRRTPAQVLLRWSLQHRLVAIPKSARPERIRENASIFDFTLGREDMESLDGLEQGLHFDWDPTHIA